MAISKFEEDSEGKTQNSGEREKKYDLEERTALFAGRVRDFCLRLPKNAANTEYVPQLIRAGSSPGANYIEANEAIGDKDFKMKIKTCRRSKGITILVEIDCYRWIRGKRTRT